MWLSSSVASGQAVGSPTISPARTMVKCAKGFTIQYLSGYKVITVFGSAGKAAQARRYALVPRGKVHPAGFAQGSNNYWKAGAVRPDLVLGDLIELLHPALLPGRPGYYYQKLRG